MALFKPGDEVQTPLGKGIVREARGNARLLIEIRGRAVVIEEISVAPLQAVRRNREPLKGATEGEPFNGTTMSGGRHAATEVDLHGLTVEEALARAEQALNDAILADLPELRLIHGRSSGRIKAALHKRLRHIGAVQAVRLDPRNAGVTIVTL